MATQRTERKLPETTITGKNQITLPAESLRRLGWKRGDHVLVNVIGDDFMVLMRRPESFTAFFAGKLGHVFGTHQEVLRYLDEERASWAEFERRADR